MTCTPAIYHNLSSIVVEHEGFYTVCFKVAMVQMGRHQINGFPISCTDVSMVILTCMNIITMFMHIAAYHTLKECAQQKGVLMEKIQVTNKIKAKRKQLESLREELRVLGTLYIHHSVQNL